MRRNDDDGAANVVQITTQVEPARLAVKAGDFYVPMDRRSPTLLRRRSIPTAKRYAANRVLRFR